MSLADHKPYFNAWDGTLCSYCDKQWPCDVETLRPTVLSAALVSEFNPNDFEETEGGLVFQSLLGNLRESLRILGVSGRADG